MTDPQHEQHPPSTHPPWPGTSPLPPYAPPFTLHPFHACPLRPQSNGDGVLEWTDVWAYVDKRHAGRWYSGALRRVLQAAQATTG